MGATPEAHPCILRSLGGWAALLLAVRPSDVRALRGWTGLGAGCSIYILDLSREVAPHLGLPSCDLRSAEVCVILGESARKCSRRCVRCVRVAHAYLQLWDWPSSCCTGVEPRHGGQGRDQHEPHAAPRLPALGASALGGGRGRALASCACTLHSPVCPCCTLLPSSGGSLSTSGRLGWPPMT